MAAIIVEGEPSRKLLLLATRYFATAFQKFTILDKTCRCDQRSNAFLFWDGCNVYRSRIRRTVMAGVSVCGVRSRFLLPELGAPAPFKNDALAKRRLREKLMHGAAVSFRDPSGRTFVGPTAFFGRSRQTAGRISHA